MAYILCVCVKPELCLSLFATQEESVSQNDKGVEEVVYVYARQLWSYLQNHLRLNLKNVLKL